MSELNVYQAIVDPLIPLLKKEAEQLKADNYTLSLYFFSLNLCYAIIAGIRSIRLLITETKTSKEAQSVGIKVASSSMYSEAFERYEPMIFKRLLLGLLDRLSFKEIPEIATLGRFILIDGSIFPAIKTMSWACYKKTSNGIKVHLSFELNRLIPVQFISTQANGSERMALKALLEAGVTYIADRGYIAFDLFEQIEKQSAFFIIRVKSNMAYVVRNTRDISLPDNWHRHLNAVTDNLVCFTGDKPKNSYRLITFEALGETYRIATNRLDLKTHEIIMLYAYRWQIELFFRCIKRCFNGLHLWTHSEKGIEIQFYLYMITYLLLLNFKQRSQDRQNEIDNIEESDGVEKPSKKIPAVPLTRTPACGIVTLLGDRLKGVWKIGIHWLKAVKNQLTSTWDIKTIRLLNSA